MDTCEIGGDEESGDLGVGLSLGNTGISGKLLQQILIVTPPNNIK